MILYHYKRLYIYLIPLKKNEIGNETNLHLLGHWLLTDAYDLKMTVNMTDENKRRTDAEYSDNQKTME